MTAYEMRISDESSDVCSSDLAPDAAARAAAVIRAAELLPPDHRRGAGRCAVRGRAGDVRVEPAFAVGAAEAAIAGRREAVAASAAPAKAGQRTARPTMPAEDLHDPAADHHPRAGNRRTLRARDGSGRAERQQGVHGGGVALRHCQLAVAARDRKSTRLNSSHYCAPRMPSSAYKKKKH